MTTYKDMAFTKNKFQILDTDLYDENGKEIDNEKPTYGTRVRYDLISDGEDTLTEGETDGGRGSAIDLTTGSATEEEETGREAEKKGNGKRKEKEKEKEKGKVRELVIPEVTIEELRSLGKEAERRAAREMSPSLVDMEAYALECRVEEIIRAENERREREEERMRQEEEEKKRMRKKQQDRKEETPIRKDGGGKGKKEVRNAERSDCRVQLERIRDERKEDFPPLGTGERRKRRMTEERDGEIAGTSGTAVTATKAAPRAASTPMMTRTTAATPPPSATPRREEKRMTEERMRANASTEEEVMPVAIAEVRESLKKIKSRVMEIIEHLRPKNIRNSMKEECYTIAKELAETERLLNGGRKNVVSELDSDEEELRGFEQMMEIGTQLQKRKMVEEKSPEGVKRKRRKEGETAATVMTPRKRMDEQEENGRTMMTRYQKRKEMEEMRYAGRVGTYAQAASRGRRMAIGEEKERRVRRRVTFSDTDEEIRGRHRYDRGTITSDSEEEISRGRRGILKKPDHAARRRVIVSSESEEETRGLEEERGTRGRMTFLERRMEGIKERTRKEYDETERSARRTRRETPVTTEEEEMQEETMSPEEYERIVRSYGRREVEQWVELKSKRMKREQRRREREEQRAREEERLREERRINKERRARIGKARREERVKREEEYRRRRAAEERKRAARRPLKGDSVMVKIKEGEDFSKV